MEYLRMYSIYDRLSGIYSEPFVVQNDEVAKRRFNYYCQNAAMIAGDCELYYVGDFECCRGMVYGNDNPIFICRYEVNYGENE